MRRKAERDPTLQRPSPPDVPPRKPKRRSRRRESVAQYVAEHIDSSKFAQRASSLSNIEKETDEFQQHMQRVFERGVGKLERRPAGNVRSRRSSRGSRFHGSG